MLVSELEKNADKKRSKKMAQNCVHKGHWSKVNRMSQKKSDYTLATGSMHMGCQGSDKAVIR